jgi:hypothetical protein
MIKANLIAFAIIAALGIGSSGVAVAQSAYTSGTAASSETAGYPSPYGYGSGLYAYAPGHFTGGRDDSRQPGQIGRFGEITRLQQLAYGGHDFDRESVLFSSADDAMRGCGRGRVRDPQTHQCLRPVHLS